MKRRGEVAYKTVAHIARCENCSWKAKPVPVDAPAKIIRYRNSSAATHARRNGHDVVVEIQRVFRYCEDRA